MPGEEYGILGGARGGLDENGVIVAETGSIGLQTNHTHAELPRPANTSEFQVRRFGDTEIGFCCDSYTANSSRSVTEIRTMMKHSGASACVLVGYQVSFPPRHQGCSIFQAYCRLTVSGPFLPKEVAEKSAQERPRPPHENPPPADRWEKALARLLQHEVGHITKAWADLLDANFEFEQKLDVDNLTYEVFSKEVRESENTMKLVLPASRDSWDNSDLSDTEQYIKDPLWIYMPIKKQGETLN